MKQIEGTVNSCLGQLVGAGLIIFFGFMFLMTSAQLSKSILGDLLAQAAGETARTARSESFTFWGKVGQEVASGIGYSGGVEAGPTSTPMAIVVTATPQAPTNNAAPQPTPRPIVYVRDGQFSRGGLLVWQGVDKDKNLLPEGVLLPVVKQQVDLALGENPGDLTALWLQKKVEECQPDYNLMLDSYRKRQNAADAETMRNTAQKLIDKCNPRMRIAYAYKRWADIVIWWQQENPDNARETFQGLSIKIEAKASGPERGLLPTDEITVTVQAPLQDNKNKFLLNDISGVLTANVLDNIFGAGQWQIGDTKTMVGSLYPPNPAEPFLPTEAELTPPVTAAPAATASTAAAAQKSLPASGKYVVQSGDTIYGIARKFNVTVDRLVAANQNTPGFNAFYPDLIVPGQELVIPTP